MVEIGGKCRYLPEDTIPPALVLTGNINVLYALSAESKMAVTVQSIRAVVYLRRRKHSTSIRSFPLQHCQTVWVLN